MGVYITFLRGVNMAGHSKIKMTSLQSLYKKLGYKDAVTYIQSGNVVFSSSENEDIIAGRIEKGILEEFGHNVPVMIRELKEIENIIQSNPFLGIKDFDPSRSAVIFLYSKPDKVQISKMEGINYPPDRYEISGREIFIYCPNGFGRTKLYTNFFEDKMKVTGTARNWKTIYAVREIALTY
jgi:uncharacterized protein (DUF1697 family)